ncbi:MAG: STAS domain-containing protein [Gammaproteobacteria bacterium]|nr:STAS domain-containing protein [Gammaproteobacteria bacterium]MCF6229341.1 STAS domain-containing protein [Gammaproteobacteria bacterium]
MAALATIESQGAGKMEVKGDLVFSSVTSLLAESVAYFKPQEELSIDLAAVTHSDSAGVALLLEWMQMAKLRNLKLSFSNIPAQMWTIIDVSGLAQRLPLLNSSQSP